MSTPESVADLMRVELPRRLDPGAFLTLVRMTVQRHVRGRRLLVLGLLFLLPTAIALLARMYRDGPLPPDAEEVLVFYMIPQALLPLTALVLAAGMIQDEVEEQTFTYLLVRPVPRWAIYLAKLAGTILVSALVTVAFTTLTLAAIHAGEPGFVAAELRDRAWRIGALFTLASVCYTAIFGCLSLVVKRALVVGVAYVLLFEGLFANIDFVVRRVTVMYYVRLLAERWLGSRVSSWSIRLDEAPSGRDCLLYLLGAVLVSTTIAGVLMSLREFRLKTPEGT
jgi:ABC-2 type transport system permease protein